MGQFGKFVPQLADEKDYLNFMKEVKLCEAMIPIKEEQRSLNTAFRHPKKAKAVVLDTDTCHSSKGVTSGV